jgi:hypothetical protein
MFAKGSIWEQFPYLLPNLVCTVIVLCGVVVGILFLEETHEEKKLRRDPGLEVGKWILSKFTRCARTKNSTSEKDMDQWENVPLLNEEDQPPGYCTAEGSPSLASTSVEEPVSAINLNDTRSLSGAKPAATKAFTTQVVRNIIGYGILA